MFSLSILSYVCDYPDYLPQSRRVQLKHRRSWATDGNRKSNVAFCGVVLLLTTDRKSSCWWLWLNVTNAMAWKRSKKGKIQFPVAVRGSKTSVLKFPINLGLGFSMSSLTYVYVKQTISNKLSRCHILLIDSNTYVRWFKGLYCVLFSKWFDHTSHTKNHISNIMYCY